MTSYEPDGSLPHSEIVLIAGGGGGGGEGSAFYSGSLTGGGGGNGGFAYSNQVGTSATGVGGNAFDDSMDHWSGLGGGGTGCTEGVACGGGGYNTGYQGFGGASGGSGSEGSRAGSMVDPVWRLMPGKAQRAAIRPAAAAVAVAVVTAAAAVAALQTVRYLLWATNTDATEGRWRQLRHGFNQDGRRRPNVPCRKYRRRRSANDFQPRSLVKRRALA